MAFLHARVAIAAAAHRDMETAHDGAPDNLFLILRLAAFRFHAATTMRTALRQRNRNLFIHPRRDKAARLPAIVSALRVRRVSGCVLGGRANGARPAACWRATPLPVPSADARLVAGAALSPVAAAQSAARPGPTLAWGQNQSFQVLCPLRAGLLVSSKPTVVAETARLSSEIFSKPISAADQAGKQIPFLRARSRLLRPTRHIISCNARLDEPRYDFSLKSPLPADFQRRKLIAFGP
jgi:hypothetical protein